LDKVWPTPFFPFATEGSHMTRHRLTDEQWKLIADVFPPPAETGRPLADRRKIVDGILWVVRAGAPWRDLPEEESRPWETIYGLFNAWNDDGELDQILARLQTSFFDADEIDNKLWCIDGTIARAHRCAAGGGKKTIQRSQSITH
jgi:transposase